MTSSKCPRNFLPIQRFSPLKSMTSFQTHTANDMILSHFFADSSKTRSYMSNLMISKFYQKSSQNRFKMKTHSHIISDRHKTIPISGTRDEKIDLRNCTLSILLQSYSTKFAREVYLICKHHICIKNAS